jgi:hypothetical protein
MNLSRYMKLTLLIAFALFLAIVLARVLRPAPVQAQVEQGYPFYVEPGYTMLRKPDGTAQVYGKMVIDMRNGDIWGFPTLTQSPYPVDTTQTRPPQSSPIYLGKFLFNQATKGGGGVRE